MINIIYKNKSIKKYIFISLLIIAQTINAKILKQQIDNITIYFDLKNTIYASRIEKDDGNHKYTVKIRDNETIFSLNHEKKRRLFEELESKYIIQEEQEHPV